MTVTPRFQRTMERSKHPGAPSNTLQHSEFGGHFWELCISLEILQPSPSDQLTNWIGPTYFTSWNNSTVGWKLKYVPQKVHYKIFLWLDSMIEISWTSSMYCTSWICGPSNTQTFRLHIDNLFSTKPKQNILFKMAATLHNLYSSLKFECLICTCG